MELRWYQTYDKGGGDSEMVLQTRERVYPCEYTDWEDVPTLRERDPNADLTPQNEEGD